MKKGAAALWFLLEMATISSYGDAHAINNNAKGGNNQFRGCFMFKTMATTVIFLLICTGVRAQTLTECGKLDG
jgi:hypothetical protein